MQYKYIHIQDTMSIHCKNKYKKQNRGGGYHKKTPPFFAKSKHFDYNKEKIIYSDKSQNMALSREECHNLLETKFRESFSQINNISKLTTDAR